MTGDPSLIEDPADRPAWEGAYTAEALADAASRIREDGGLLLGLTAGENVVLMNMNPVIAIETLAANGLGWVMDHLEPLSTWLNDFAGEHEQVFAFAGTWQNIAIEVGDIADTLASQIGDLDDLEGLTADAYRNHLISLADSLVGAQDVASAAADTLRIAADAVRDIHRAIRDGISAVLIGIAESAALGPIGAVLAPEIVGLKVAALVARLGPRVIRVLEALARVAAALDNIAPALSKTLQWLSRALARGQAVEHRRISGPELPDADSPVGNGETALPQFENIPAWLQRQLDRYENPEDRWRRRIWEGNAFNYSRNEYYEDQGGYNEVGIRVPDPDGGKDHRYRVDSYIPDEEIVSRKHTQLSELSDRTAKSYIDEFVKKKYIPGTPLWDGGPPLEGELILEVPPQEQTVPEWLLEYADNLKDEDGNPIPVTIRDSDGRRYN